MNILRELDTMFQDGTLFIPIKAGQQMNILKTVCQATAGFHIFGPVECAYYGPSKPEVADFLLAPRTHEQLKNNLLIQLFETSLTSIEGSNSHITKSHLRHFVTNVSSFYSCSFLNDFVKW